MQNINEKIKALEKEIDEAKKKKRKAAGLTTIDILVFFGIVLWIILASLYFVVT